MKGKLMLSQKTSPTYNLGAITRETGLNADTLRAWERRYNLPQPARSAGGQRLYSPRDLEIVKWLISRQKEGLRISQAAKLWHTQVDEGINPLEDSSQADTQVPMYLVSGENIGTIKSRWISACLSFNEIEAEQIISEAFSQYSPETVCFEVLFAGLSEIGESWYQGVASVQQEHFASALVARRLNALIAALPIPSRPKRIVVASPHNEEHTLPSLLITFLLRRRGWDVIFLGADVPLDNFKITIKELEPELLILTAQQLHTASSLLELMNELLDLQIKLAFGGLIFNNNPNLYKHIPGHFLGEQLEDIVVNSEHILGSSNDNPLLLAPDSSPLLKPFQSAMSKIEAYLLEYSTSSPEFQSAHSRYLSRDILAALRLGSLDFLNTELEWVEGLLSNAQFTDIDLQQFLLNYQNAVEKYLGANSEPILTWLQSVIKKLNEKH